MNDKFSLYQTDGLWGIIENTSNEKQTSIKSYFGSDLIIKRLNEQDQQIDRLKQQLAEKEKENEELKLKLDIRAMNLQNINTERMEAVRNQTQLAIQELEKVKVNLKDRITMMSNEEHSYLQKVVIWYDICNQVNKQINDLRGEKDVKD